MGRRVAFAAFWLAALGATPIARAQVAPATPEPAPAPAPEEDDDLASMSLEQLMRVEVVSASATPQAVEDVPSTVYVFTEETIRRRGYRSLPQLLEDVPELQIHFKAAPDFGELVSVRGITGAGTEKLIILYDGVRVDAAGNSPVSIGHDFSLANVDRVEVVLGPVSALYGPDAFTAVVHVRTKGGAALHGGRASVGWGRFHTGEASLVAGGEKNGFALAVTAALYHSDEPYLPDFYGDDFAWYRDRYLTGGEVLTAPGATTTVPVPIQPWATPTDDRFAALRLDVGEFHLGVVHLDHAHDSTFPTRPEIGLYVGDATWAYSITSIAAEHSHKTDDGKLELTSSLAIHRYDVDPRTAFVNVFSAYRPGYKYEHYDTAELEERINYQVSKRLSAAIGGSFTTVSGMPKSGDLDHRYDPDLPGAEQNLYYPGSDIVDARGQRLAVPEDFLDISERAAGAYIEALATPHPRIAITAGGRIDQHSRYGRSVNPRLGVTWKPDAATQVKLLYGQAFLAPSPNQAFQHHGTFVAATDGGGAVTGLESFFFRLPNPDLRPERIRMGELIVFRRVGDALRLSANAYLGDVRDRFGSGFVTDTEFKGWPVATVLLPINLGDRFVTYGGTLGAQGQLRRAKWEIDPSLAYSLTGGHRGDDPLPATSTHVVKAVVDVERGPASLSLRGIYRSSARHPETRVDPADPASDLVRIPGSTLVDLHARWRFLPDAHAHTTLWLDVHNLLDARYHTVSNAFDQFPGVPQDPLRVMLGIDAEL